LRERVVLDVDDAVGDGPGVGGGDEAFFLADFQEEPGAAAVAQESGQNVQGGHVRMADDAVGVIQQLALGVAADVDENLVGVDDLAGRIAHEPAMVCEEEETPGEYANDPASRKSPRLWESACTKYTGARDHKSQRQREKSAQTGLVVPQINQAVKQCGGQRAGLQRLERGDDDHATGLQVADAALDVQEFLRANGAAAALMSGSGSTTFAIFPTQAAAEALVEKFKARFGQATWMAVVQA